MSDLLGRIGVMRLAVIFGIALLSVVVVAGLLIFSFLRTNETEDFTDLAEHFKYGSTGTEAEGGIPYWIWRVLPELFPEHLPDRSGDGYEQLGFIYESPSHNRPVGMTFRENPVPLISLNCGACHAGTFRESPESPRQVILGMPAHQFDPQGYVKFLIASGGDERFNADTLIPAIKAVNPNFSWLDSLFYRFVVVPRTKEGLQRRGEQSYWFDQFPHQGPGRIDIFSQNKVILDIGVKPGDPSGTTEFTSIWNQAAHQGLPGRWDGNSTVPEELARAAALGGGATPESLDLGALAKVDALIKGLQPPAFPSDKIDQSSVSVGAAVFQTNCAICHAFDGEQIGEITAIEDIGTDPHRLDNVTGELINALNTEGGKQPWGVTHFRKTDGYVNMPLDGLWLRAPYLHNGSVATLSDLLRPPAERPQVFYRGYDVYDFVNAGFISTGPEAEANGLILDTRLPGNSNQGHIFGTALSPQEKEALVEFLKTQ
jgi:mono/diheme cytochrome c family protein